MTVQPLSGFPIYTVSGTGPYAVQFGFSQLAHVRLSLLENGIWVDMEEGDWALTAATPSPTDTYIGGAITLTSAAATTLAGHKIRPYRLTPLEQGWQGVGGREVGNERQQDATARAVQELQHSMSRALRMTNSAAPFEPIPDTVLAFDANARPVAGPTVQQLYQAVQALESTVENAAFADARATAADVSAQEAANQVAGVIPSRTRFAVGGAVQSVDLGNAELVPAALSVYIDGVYQFGDTWSLTAGVLAPVGGSWPGNGVTENMEVVVDATAAISFNVPSDGSVTRDKLAPNLQEKFDIPIFASETPFKRAGIRVVTGLERDAHYGFNNGILDAGSGKWVVVYRRASNHTVVNGAEIRAVDTYDKGATFTNDRLIYTFAAADTRNFVSRVMGNGRLGIICSRREEAPSLAYIDPVFLYSDDGGVTWSSQVVAPNTAGQAVNFHGNWIDYPASVGGHDTQGFIAYSYAGSGAGNVDALVTTDNGATWSWTMNAATSASTVTEMACARVGTQDKWIMIARPAGTIGTPALAWTSDDPLDFGASISAGVEGAGNPPFAIYDSETGLFWYGIVARRDRGWKRDTTNGSENVVLMASADADALYAAGGSMSALGIDWSIVSYLPDWGAGYHFPFKIDGGWWSCFVCAEEYPGHNYSLLCLLGDFIPTAKDTANYASLFSWNALGSRAVYRQGVEAGFGLTSPTESGYLTVGVAGSVRGIVSETFSDSSR